VKGVHYSIVPWELQLDGGTCDAHLLLAGREWKRFEITLREKNADLDDEEGASTHELARKL
jgi:hypothetical protein